MKDGKFVEAADLGVFQNLTGVQVFAVPATVTVDDFNEVYIWCKKFAVPLGVVTL